MIEFLNEHLEWILDGGLAAFVGGVAARLYVVRKRIEEMVKVADSADFDALLAEVQPARERADRLYEKTQERLEEHLRSRLH